MKPLEQFICDTCGEIINSTKEGWIEWISKYDIDKDVREIHSFNIVHHNISSPRSKGCYQHDGVSGESSMHLDQFINEDYKMANILRFLDMGSYHDPSYKGSDVTDMRQYVEMVRRLTIPYYEEARTYWEDALNDGYFQDQNEISIYSVENLKKLIETYRK